MKTLQDEDEDAFKRQFSKYIKEGVTSETVSANQIVIVNWAKFVGLRFLFETEGID